MADATTGDTLRSLIFEVDGDGKASLSVLDQLLLPHETKYVPILNVEDAWDAVSPPRRGWMGWSAATGRSSRKRRSISHLRIIIPRPPTKHFSPLTLHHLGGGYMCVVVVVFVFVFVVVVVVVVSETQIRSMRIRGAPLIAIVAVLGLAVDLTSNDSTLRDLAAMLEEDGGGDIIISGGGVRDYVYGKMAYLITSRPTAVNLANAMEELRGIVGTLSSSSPSRDIVDAIVSHGRYMLERDVSDNVAIGTHGANDLLSRHAHPEGVRLVTICNTGSLATAGWGTALGVARELHRRRKLRSIACLETRPYNQGSRLTAYEILAEKMDGILICDSMAASYLKTRGADACVVGADRVCANGDTANKIGTFALSIIAKEMGVEFFVASPFTTLDVSLATGNDIEIEERPADEMLESACAPKGMTCWNPGFDVTPAKYISGIITERGVLKKSSDGTFDVVGFVRENSS
jgi:S-methyl-5-thioribose-1-phosphate isomerase